VKSDKKIQFFVLFFSLSCSVAANSSGAPSQACVVSIDSINGMGDRGRNGNNTVTVTTATPGADVTVTVTAAAGQGNVVGWVGGVFEAAEGGAALAGATPTADSKKCGTSEALTHNKALAATSATFTWKVPADAPVDKEYFARVVSLNGAEGGGEAQKFAISATSFKVVAAGASTAAATSGNAASSVTTTAGEVKCDGKTCADCIKETAACSWCDSGRAASEKAGSDSTIAFTGTCTQGTTCTAEKAGLNVKFTTCKEKSSASLASASAVLVAVAAAFSF
jgi:hypothetical protein